MFSGLGLRIGLGGRSESEPPQVQSQRVNNILFCAILISSELIMSVFYYFDEFHFFIHTPHAMHIFHISMATVYL